MDSLVGCRQGGAEAGEGEGERVEVGLEVGVEEEAGVKEALCAFVVLGFGYGIANLETGLFVLLRILSGCWLHSASGIRTRMRVAIGIGKLLRRESLVFPHSSPPSELAFKLLLLSNG